MINITDLTDGYYWIKNLDYEDKVIHRPILVTVIKESGYYFKNQWFSPGTYFQFMGNDSVHHINYLTDPLWKGLEFFANKKGVEFIPD